MRLTLLIFAFLMTKTLSSDVRVPQGAILSYDNESRQLHLRCPKPDSIRGKILYMYVARVSPGEEHKFANWTPGDGAMAEDDWAKIANRYQQGSEVLEVKLDHVTCKDSGIYQCSVLVTAEALGAQTFKQDQTFLYEGEITRPVVDIQPMKARFEDGEKVTFNCSARIGTEDNSFVWESRLPGEPFAVVEENGDTCTKIKTDQPLVLPTCDVYASTSLELKLSPLDDGREWRCRTQQSNHEARMTVAVDCPDSSGCAGRCNSPVIMAVAASTEDVKTADTGPSARFSREEEEESPNLVVLLAVLPISVALALVAVTISVCRRRREKQPPPLVFVGDSQSGTEYDFSADSSTGYPVFSPSTSYASRCLPDPPATSGTDNSDSDNTYTTAPDDTPPKISPYGWSQPRPSSSVYVSMSALQDPEPGERVASSPSSPPAGGDDGERARRPLFERSTSVYSNDTCLAGVARSRANSASDGGAVRAHDTYRKQLL